tara:strand:+ start:1700 stop:3253 length:1554 start_codon:yes stop_codon:yes gene_type:complete
MTSIELGSVALRLHQGDHVGVLKKAIKIGTKVISEDQTFTALATIPSGHKIALATVVDGAPVRKYGQIIGFAQGNIAPGDHVHSHNLVCKEYEREHEFCADYQPIQLYDVTSRRSFKGYSRPGGQAGTRNYIAVISNVNCSNSVSKYVANHFNNSNFRKQFPDVDGIIALKTQGGCGVEPGGPMQIIRRTLGNMARHPNISGYVMIGLGCEDNQIQGIREDYELDKLEEGEVRPEFMTIQGTGGSLKTIQAAIRAVENILPKVADVKRTEQPLSKLLLAENCGGSDGSSGCTANPALGYASDELVNHGGTSVLAETTEIYGAEHLLTNRSVSPEVAEKLMNQIRWWEEYARRHNSTIDNNPSIGNKEGGLTTIYEKSLGALAKAGQSPLMAVYNYAEKINTPGLGFMDTPGYDPISMTGLVAGGCNVGVFTTGRGSVYGCKPAPCIKVASNTALYQWMEEDMDINAGTIIDGTETISEVGMRIFEKIISVASGEKTKSELNGIGDEEFQPWFPGPQY